MKIDIIDKKNDALFQRDIIIAKCEFDGATPSILELKNRIAAQLGVKEDVLVVKNIFTEFGSQSGKLEVRVYKDVESLKKAETEKVIKRNTPKKEEKPAEAAPAEKPAEEKKEAPAEKPVEAKPAEAAEKKEAKAEAA